LRILKRLLAGLLLSIVAGLAIMYIADPVITSRMIGLAFGGNSGPEEAVPGGPLVEIPSVPLDRRSIDPDAVRKAEAYAAEAGSHALIVYHNGAIQVERYYPGYGRDSRTPTQSMHKSVLALLVGIAIRDGFIASVDDPAARYLPEWANDGRSGITIRQLLQQQSGIDFPTVGFNPVGGFFQFTLGDDIKPITLNQPLAEEPGTRFDYNAINPQALGIIIERATGRRYAEYLSEALWTHLGAPDAFVSLDSTNNGMARTFCCLNATARSWLHVGLLHLNAGRFNGAQIVPESWMRDAVTPSPRNPNYGYLTWLGNEYQERRHYNHKTSTSVYHSEPFAAQDMVYFDGFGGQRVYVVKSLGLVIVRTGAIDTGWDDAYLPNVIIRGLTTRTDGKADR
jgi:CubicO group peptidase (beta-lactamase class C family)